MARVQGHKPAELSQSDPGTLTAEIQHVLAVLSEVEVRYERDRECLKGWSGPEAIRVRFVEQLEAHHAQEQQPLVQRLAQLHQETTTEAMFKRLHSLQHSGAEIGNGSGEARSSRRYRTRGSSGQGM
jgi:hypothetical protein